jgi:hypothetical protein
VARKPVSDAELAALGEFQGSIERNANFRQQVANHNLGRNLRVIKLLSYLGLLRRSGKSLTGTVECVAALLQNFSSSKSMTHLGLPAGTMQAAHFLPGQVRIAGHPAWEYASDPGTRGQMEFLFAEVEHLPLVFNQADTAAEAKGRVGGLCAALAKACQSMIAKPDAAGSGTSKGRIPMGLLEAAYKDWHNEAIAALRNAIASKGSKEVVPPLVGDAFSGYTMESISARSTAGATVWNRDISIRVLEAYLADQQQQRSWTWAAGSCQSALREIEYKFKP